MEHPVRRTVAKPLLPPSCRPSLLLNAVDEDAAGSHACAGSPMSDDAGRRNKPC
jgi:hypothetical protein